MWGSMRGHPSKGAAKGVLLPHPMPLALHLWGFSLHFPVLRVPPQHPHTPLGEAQIWQPCRVFSRRSRLGPAGGINLLAQQSRRPHANGLHRVPGGEARLSLTFVKFTVSTWSPGRGGRSHLSVIPILGLPAPSLPLTFSPLKSQHPEKSPQEPNFPLPLGEDALKGDS